MGRKKEWAKAFLEGRDLDLLKDRKNKMNGTNGPSEGKDEILSSRVPSPVPFFYLRELLFLALPPVCFSCVWAKRKGRSRLGLCRLLNTGSRFVFGRFKRELGRLRARISRKLCPRFLNSWSVARFRLCSSPGLVRGAPLGGGFFCVKCGPSLGSFAWGPG